MAGGGGGARESDALLPEDTVLVESQRDLMRAINEYISINP